MTEQKGKGKAADVDDVLAALKKQPPKVRGGHSPIYLWLWQHHDRLKSDLNLPRRTDWSALAGELGKRGIVDGDGKQPTAERTRKAWWQVNRDKEAVAAGTIRRRKAVQPIRAPDEAAPPMPANATPAASLGMLPPSVEPPEEQPPKYTFKFAKAKDWTKETDKGDE